jgi:hypothetical protein
LAEPENITDSRKDDRLGWRRYITLALLAGVLAFLVALAPVYYSLREFRGDLIGDLRVQAQIISHGKMDTLSTWIDSKADLGGQLSNNTFVQLLAAEYSQATNGGSVQAALSEQLPYINRAFDLFIEQNELRGAYLFSSDGVAIASAISSPPITEYLREAVRQTAGRSDIKVLNFRSGAKGVVLDFLTPVYGPQFIGSEEDRPVKAILLVTVPANDIVEDTLSSQLHPELRQSTYLLQRGDPASGRQQEMVGSTSVDAVENVRAGTEGAGENFLKTGSVASNTIVYSYLVIPEDFQWRIVFEANTDVIEVPFSRYLYIGLALAGLFALLMFTATMALGWRDRVNHIDALSKEFRRLQALKDKMINNSLRILIQAVEKRHQNLSGHSMSLAHLTKGTAAELGLTSRQQSELEQASLLSQICKSDLPKEIFDSRKRLDKEQKQLLRSRIADSLSKVAVLDLDDAVRQAIKQVFERLDGSGFPNGLKGDQIPVLSRILSTGDVFVARLSPRAYRETITAQECIEVFRANPDKYDQEVVGALARFIDTAEGQAVTRDIASVSASE